MIAKLKEGGFVAFRADVTNVSDTNHPTYRFMRELGNTTMSLPFVAIIPGNAPNRPVLITRVVEKDRFLALLDELISSADSTEH